MSRVTIRLDNSTYLPGGSIRGEAICYFRSPKEFRKIRIRMQCHESTQWSKSESYYDHHSKQNRIRMVRYSGDHDIIFHDDIVHGEDRLPSGQHVFPINFTLPYNLPSSYSCNYGGIYYTIKVTVDRAFKVDLEDVRAFTVFSPILLQNAPLHLLERADLADEKTVGCCCCRSGHIELRVSLETRAFVVGKSAKIKVYCLNMSNNNVEGLILEMKQKVTYRTTYPSTDYRYDSELVARSNNSGVGAHGEKTYNLLLEIPPSTVAPNFTGCELFKNCYSLKIIAVLSGCHTDLSIKFDVTLGHVPHPSLPPANTEYQQQPQQQVQGSADSSEWETIEEYAENGPPIAGMPTQMPMPTDGYGLTVPYSPFNPSAPSAPQGVNPSAPSTSNLAQIHLGVGQAGTSSHDPPPSYDEAIKIPPPPK